MNFSSLTVFALAGAALASALLKPPHSSGQAAEIDPALTALCNEVAAQQVVLADHQTKMDAKLASISENVRLARIYAARSGGKAQ